MPMFVAENEEQLLEVFKKMAQQMQPQIEKDERLYLSVKDFAKDTRHQRNLPAYAYPI